MAPVIQAHFGGLFCGRWTPEGEGVVYKSEGFWPVLRWSACDTATAGDM